MNILGIGGFSHDSAAAIVQNGQLVAAVAEERLTRRKHQGGVPREAVAYCLEAAELTIDDIDHIGCYMRPGLRLARRIPYRLGTLFRSPKYALAYCGYECLHNAEYIAGMRSLRGENTQLHFLDHHPAHAASAFLASPHEKAALLSIDYVGEWDATWLGVGEGADIRRLGSIAYPHSLGLFYTAITEYLGFQRASDEYKVMGLASYGEPEHLEAFREIIRPTPDGRYRFDLSWFTAHYLPGPRHGYFSPKFIERFGPPRTKGEPIDDRHAAIAASAQALLEEIVLHIAKNLHKQTGLDTLCLAGGVALNCSMNGRLLREGPFKRIWIQPAAGDDGIAIGAALQLHHRHGGGARAFTMEHAFYGPEFSNEAIQAALDTAKVPYRRAANLAADAAQLLAAGNITGWFQGRMEFGPRSLGSRSILADPTRADMKDLINKFVKHREEFRPFAPTVLAERSEEFFEGCADSPFMLFVHPVRPEKRELLPAITHVDGTARVQTLTREANPRLYDTIGVFERLRGVPVVLNTSFNVMGEPIVHTPADALRCFFSTGMDALVIGDFIVTKPRQ